MIQSVTFAWLEAAVHSSSQSEPEMKKVLRKKRFEGKYHLQIILAGSESSQGQVE
jgi:hypothetical protein